MFAKKPNGLNDFKKLNTLKPPTNPTKAPANILITLGSKLPMKSAIPPTVSAITLTTVPNALPNVSPLIPIERNTCITAFRTFSNADTTAVNAPEFANPLTTLPM